MHPLTRRTLLSGASAALLWPSAPARAATAGLTIVEGEAFGAGWRVLLPDAAALRGIGRALEAELAAVDGAMSPYRPDSEIGRFNATSRPGWFALSPESHGVVRRALAVARASDGAYDPTVGGIVARYGFGPIRSNSLADYRNLSLAEGALHKADARLTLDLCGIAKGHAADRLARSLQSLGATSYLIEISGELRAGGQHPKGRPWQVAIEAPIPGQPRPHRLVSLRDGAALATSGDRVNSYSVAGIRYSHIIDPRRQIPVQGRLASVSVRASNAAWADAWATALFAAGHEAGVALARKYRLSALFILRDGADLHDEITGDFGAYLLV